MKLVFLGTRGEIEARTRRHRRHTSTLVSYRGTRVMLDCGRDWRTRVWSLRPHAIAITHAHPDHAGGLEQGSPCPVHATREAWRGMAHCDIDPALRRVVVARRPIGIGCLRFEAFRVVHSTRAPAVGYRIEAGRVAISYVPDVVAIPERSVALANVRLYVGDGASPTRPLVRRDRRSGQLVGHTTVRAQIGWCAQEAVPRMIVTHCGSAIVARDERRIAPFIRRLGAEQGVRVELAHDGMELVLR